MTTKRIAMVAAGFLLIGFGIGAGAAGADDQANTDSAVASAVAAVTPAPTPDPTPTPSPQIIEIEVAPQECIDSFDMLLDQILVAQAVISDVYAAYLDHPDENLGDFGQRVETLFLNLDIPTEGETAAMLEAAEICRSAA